LSKPGRNALKKAFLTRLTPVCDVLVCGFSMPEPESELVKQAGAGELKICAGRYGAGRTRDGTKRSAKGIMG
jgi:hypothetical protein